MTPKDRGDQSDGISLAAAGRLAGVSTSTLRRWADDGLLPVADGKWTAAAAAQARVIARMRERGYSVDIVVPPQAQLQSLTGPAEFFQGGPSCDAGFSTRYTYRGN